MITRRTSANPLQRLLTSTVQLLRCHLDLQREHIKRDLYRFVVRSLLLSVGVMLLLFGLGLLTAAAIVVLHYYWSNLPAILGIFGGIFSTTAIVVCYLVYTNRVLKKVDSEAIPESSASPATPSPGSQTVQNPSQDADSQKTP